MENQKLVELDYGTCTAFLDDFKMVIEPDDSPENPRDWDNLGKMWCWHKNYNLGDDDSEKPSSSQFYCWDEVENYIRQSFDIAIMLPCYLYDHSGITMKTTPFSCPFDSGQVGFIFVTKEDVRNNWNRKRISNKILEHAGRILSGEVETYAQYLSGECYGVSIKDHNDSTLDSCFGFYGMDHKKSGLAEYVNEFFVNQAA